MFNLSSDEEAEAGGGALAKKVKKAKKDPMTASATKKQVKFKERKAEQKKIETKKLETSLESVQRPEKSVPKPPEIIDLEAQLMALSKDIELSKGETKGYRFSKPSSPAQKPAKSSSSIQVMIMITRLGVDRVKPWN